MSSKNVDFYQSLQEKLSKLNRHLTFKVCEYNQNTHPKCIDVIGSAVPMKSSIKLPDGVSWYDDCNIIYEGRRVKITPYP